MQLTHLTLLLTLTIAPLLSQKLTPNAITSLLQGILSPKNTEQMTQMLTTVANKKRAITNVPQTVNRRYAIVENLPRTVKTEAPKRVIFVQNPKSLKNVVQNPKNVILRGNQMVLPKNVVVQRKADVLPKNVVFQRQAEMVLPENLVVQQRPEMVLPKNVIIQNGAATRNVIVRNEIPKRIIQNKDLAKIVEVPQKVLVTQPKAEYYVVPKQKVCSQNPFLPAASPVSAFTAASSALPPEMPKSRGQFLRKIPIPPPTI